MFFLQLLLVTYSMSRKVILTIHNLRGECNLAMPANFSVLKAYLKS
jgi:hypothetical protein